MKVRSEEHERESGAKLIYLLKIQNVLISKQIHMYQCNTHAHTNTTITEYPTHERKESMNCKQQDRVSGKRQETVDRRTSGSRHSIKHNNEEMQTENNKPTLHSTSDKR